MNNDLKPLYEKWDEYRKQSAIDCTEIDKGEFASNFNLSGLTIKWLGIQYDWKKAFIQLENKRLKLKRELVEFYKVDYNLKFDTRDELMLFVETDDRYITILEKTQVISAIIEFCGDTIKKLEGKSWEIKNYLDYLRWTKGQLN